MKRNAWRLKSFALPLTLLFIFVFAMAAMPVQGETVVGDSMQNTSADLDTGRVVSDDGDVAIVSINEATGMARFLRFPNNGSMTLVANASAEAQADAFLAEYGDLFGINNASEELVLLESVTDHLGETHLTYRQVYQGVDVFAGLVLVHLTSDNSVKVVNGVFVPELGVNVNPTLSLEEAGVLAERAVNGSELEVSMLAASAPGIATNGRLYVYRDGLLQGIQGRNHLVYEFEVTNGADVREFVYVDAHKGEIVERIDMVHDALNRTIYNMTIDPANILWQEGDPTPYAGATVTETEGVNNLIDYTEDTYDFFNMTFGYDAWDDMGSDMLATYNNPGISCPNANWNGISINFCEGTTGDDVVAHEWGHAYTESTHGLIYAWQSGALNEAYSDIWGETIDQINGAGTDTPDTMRTNECTLGGALPGTGITINSPADIAGSPAYGGAAFNPGVGPMTGDVVLVDDGTALPTQGCNALINGAEVSGNIALVDRGNCPFTDKVLNAQAAGAIAVIIANNTAGAGPMGMGGGASGLMIDALSVSFEDGELIKANLPGVNATVDAGMAGSDTSVRWLMGEDSWAFGGAIRDMWNPTCMGDPGKVSDVDQYVCSSSDNGGVHSNSGVINHTYALLVDGGTYNGVTVNAIGWVKAAHIYWRAGSVYQNPSTNFAEHADALEASCMDLIGSTLTGFGTWPDVVLDAVDCDSVADAIEATELRMSPDFCGFEPLLDPNTPPLCADATATPWYSEDFSSSTVTMTWTVTNTGVYAEYSPRDWEWVDMMPDGQSGGFYAWDTPDFGDCVPGSDDQSGAMFLDSPVWTLPDLAAGESLLVAVDHYVATEAGWDGGNVWYSVNGGTWNMVPASAFLFNPYNGSLGASDNPLAGMPAFTGTDDGDISGSWGQSQVDISGLGSVGDTVQLSFAFGVDGCNGVDGWYIDQVEIYACVAAEPDIAVDPTSIYVEQFTDVVKTRDIVVTNNGDVDLDWWLFDGHVFDQPAEGTSGIVSTEFYSLTGGAYTADDFWFVEDFTVTDVHVAGFGTPDNLASAISLNWYIYPDMGGEPAGIPNSGDGMELWSYSTTVSGAGVAIASDDISLDFEAAGITPLNLMGGTTYWLAFYPELPLASIAGSAGRWNWSQGTSNGSEAMLTDPDGLFGLPAGWSRLGSDLGFDWSGVTFMLEGMSTSCEHPAMAPWSSVSPAAGMLGPGGSGTLTATFDSTGLAEGTYTTVTCIMSNDSDEPVVPVDLTMVVEGEPDTTDVSLSGFGSESTMPWATAIAVVTMVLAGFAGLFYTKRREQTG